jgi:hypothetical protein
MADLTLHDRLRALHVGATPLAVRVNEGTRAVHQGWLAARFDAACDRAMEELVNGVARVRGVPERASRRDYV